ncbi:MAG: hypothetical protein ABIN35_00300 [candidate division WOR-3 bacterium]
MELKGFDFQSNPLLYQFAKISERSPLSDYRSPIQNQPTINRSTTDFQLEFTNQASVPLYEYLKRRHSNFLFLDHYKDFKMIDEKEIGPNDSYWDIMKTFQEKNPLLVFFFSKKNVDHLQNLIIQMVEYLSNGLYKISRQSDNELLVVMRSVYIKTPTNPLATGEQFKRNVCLLNKTVLDWVVPRIMVNIQQYLGYVRDKSQDLRFLDRPENVSIVGTKTNQSDKFALI